jgi:hypothetical protein
MATKKAAPKKAAKKTVKKAAAPVKAPVKRSRSKVKDLTDERFWEILAEKYGSYAATARAIQREFKLKSFSRVAAKMRADKDPERVKLIKGTVSDLMDDTLVDIMEAKWSRDCDRISAVELAAKLSRRLAAPGVKIEAGAGGDGKDGAPKSSGITVLKITVNE